MSLQTLTDSELAQITRARYEALFQMEQWFMLLEVNGGQYSTAAGCAEAARARALRDAARSDYDDARMEQKRREIQMVPVIGTVNG